MKRFLFFTLVLLAGCSKGFTPIEQSISDSYYYDSNKKSVIYSQGGNWFAIGYTKIGLADVKSFKPISQTYAVDKNFVFFQEKIIENEKPENFTYLGDGYARGSQGIYWIGGLLKHIDTDTFTFINSGDTQVTSYGKDKNAIYCGGDVLTTDINSFRSLKERAGKHYFADKKYVYYMSMGGCQKINANPTTFRNLKKPDGSSSVYYSDLRKVFTSPFYKVINNADATTFKALCNGAGPPHYAVDKNRVYKWGNELPGAKPDTFDFPEVCVIKGNA